LPANIIQTNNAGWGMNTAENIIPFGNQQMNNQLPEPPVPADCDLRTFRYMPFDVARFRDSRFSAVIDPGAGFFAIQLWAAAWHQVPAGSLPNEDAMLRMLSGCGRDQLLWDSVKEGALYGFAPHADGRLYHPAITEFVIEAYGKLLKNTENGKKGGRPSKPTANPTQTDGKPNANPTQTDGKPNANPTLTQHEPSEVKGSEVKGSEGNGERGVSAKPQPHQPKATCLPTDWKLPAEWMQWTLTEKPEWADTHANMTAMVFADYWHSKAGKDARKADWFATWRNWVRRENAVGGSTGASKGMLKNNQFNGNKPKSAHDDLAATTERARKLIFGNQQYQNSNVVDGEVM
jgi:hypothetical protein